MRVRFCLFVFTLCCTRAVYAVSYQQNTGSPFSQYGVITNVQNYSSNPFWTPGSPYNQRMPQPVYVQGADMNAGDCMRAVANLIAAECGARNNCIGLSLADVRPAIMVQLSRLPGHNYAASCAGFIDSEFDSYVRKYGTAAPGGRVVDFPVAAGGAVNNNAAWGTMPADDMPDWAREKKSREEELRNLQSKNGAGTERLKASDFPTTYADLSFIDRMQNETMGYAAFKDKSAYEPLGNIVMTETANCNDYETKLSIINADLATLTDCRNNNVPVMVCLSRIQGNYGW